MGYATYWTGEDLWQACGGSDIGEPPPACRAYVLGVSDGHNSSYARKGLPTLYCVRVSSMADDLTHATRAYLKAHPERRTRSAASLVFQSLALTYPCARDMP